jgi:hypothetical protein
MIRVPLVQRMTACGQSFRLIPPYVQLEAGVYNTLTDSVVPSTKRDKTYCTMSSADWMAGLARTAYIASFYGENVPPRSSVMNPSQVVTTEMLAHLKCMSEARVAQQQDKYSVLTSDTPVVTPRCFFGYDPVELPD